MILTETDSKRFYKIWLNLLDYTNKKYRIEPKLKNLATSMNINPQELFPIKNKLWESNLILEEVYQNNPFNFSQEDLEIVNSWCNRVEDKFIIYKHLKNYTIMMGNNRIYGVNGIITPLEESFPSFILPIFAEAVLLPFEGIIIYDSIMMPYNISYGGGAKKAFNDNYRDLKERYGIITTLDK